AGADTADGLEQLEQVSMQCQRGFDQVRCGCDGHQWDEGCGLPVRGNRRLLAGKPRRKRQYCRGCEALPFRDEGAGGLHPLEGAEIWNLLGCWHKNLRGTPGEPGTRISRRVAI